MTKMKIGSIMAAGLFASYANAAAPKTLVVMLDGCRSDVLEHSHVPNIRRLIDGKWQEGYNCAWTPAAQTVPDALSSSAPNHAAIALGVSTKKNNVVNNGYYGKCDYKKYPSFMVRIAEARPDAKTLFMYSWKADEALCPNPKVEFVWSRATATKMGLRKGTMRACDSANGKEFERRLAAGEVPDATLLFLDCPDHAGHGIHAGGGVGFYPYSTAYLAAITECDRIVGGCLDAIAKRPAFKDEDWLVIVLSDHGGYAKTHGLKGGHATSIPLIVSSRHVRQGRIPGAARITDVAPTVLEHFGIDYSTFDLDGQVVGRETVEDPKRPLTDGLVSYLPFDGKMPEREVNNVGTPDGSGRRFAVTGEVVADVRGAATVSGKKGGHIEGCLHVAVDTNGVGGVCLKGSENLKFENGTDFAMTMWVKIDKPQKGDTLIFGNKDWKSGNNPGVAFCAAKRTERVKKPGVVFNCTANQERKRIDVGTYDVEYGNWTFYAVTKDRDGVLKVYQGSSDGWLYCIYEDARDIRFSTGMPFFLGQDGTGRYSRTFEGFIDEFGFWKRTLSHEDVKRIYDSGRRGLSLGDLL